MVPIYCPLLINQAVNKDIADTLVVSLFSAAQMKTFDKTDITRQNQMYKWSFLDGFRWSTVWKKSVNFRLELYDFFMIIIFI